MRKAPFVFIAIIFLFAGTGVLAQNSDLPDPGLTPDSPFYIFDTLGEKINLFFTRTPEKKAEKSLRYAEERLAEAQIMAEENKPEATAKANENYQNSLNFANTQVQEAKQNGKDVEGLAVLITEATLKHQEILIQVFERVPDEAKMAIQKAIEVSTKGSEQAVQSVSSSEKKEELVQKIEDTKLRSEERIKELEEKLQRAEARIRELESRGATPAVPEKEPAKPSGIASTPTPTPTPTTPDTTQIAVPIQEFVSKPHISEPYIQLISPNGSERWVIGNTYDIKFRASKVSKVNIGLRGADKKYTIISGLAVSEGEGSFGWDVTGVDPGHYRVEIRDSANSAVFGESSLLFWVVSSGAACVDSDGGQDYSIKGTTSGVDTKGETVANSDSCGMCGTATGSSYYCVREWFCSNNFVEDTYSNCAAGDVCRDGVCVKAEKPLNLTSPNGGEQWTIGNTYTIQWENSGSVKSVFVELYKGGVYFAGLGGLGYAYGIPTTLTWNTINTSDLVSGSDFKIRIRSDRDPTIYDESDNYFSIAAMTPSPTTCPDLEANSVTNYFFGLCKQGGYDKICFNKDYSTYQGCSRSIIYNDCTLHNSNADKNIWCDTGLIYTCSDSDNVKDYNRQGTVTDRGTSYTDYCVDSGTLKEYFCSISDSNPTGISGEENYTCSAGCENGACKIPEKTILQDVENQLGSVFTAFSQFMGWPK